VGDDDSAFRAVERLSADLSGPANGDPPDKGRPEGLTVNPNRQGFTSTTRGEGSPMNIPGGIRTIATDYSPCIS
jgi:hypothetical protein